MKIRVLRKGSSGLDGTFRNAEHHAKGAIPIVHAVCTVIYSLEPHIEEWAQGHNIHMLKAKDGRWFSLRPYHSEGTWGVELKVHISRKVEFPVMTFDDWSKMADFRVVLENALRVKPNFYHRVREQQSSIKEEEDKEAEDWKKGKTSEEIYAIENDGDFSKFEYKYRFLEADNSTDYFNFDDKDDAKRNWVRLHADTLESYGYLRCPGCKGEMTFHRGPKPHFEHVIAANPNCPLYKK